MPQIYTNSVKEALLILYYIEKNWYHFIKEYLEQFLKSASQDVPRPIGRPNRHILEILLARRNTLVAQNRRASVRLHHWLLDLLKFWSTMLLLLFLFNALFLHLGVVRNLNLMYNKSKSKCRIVEMHQCWKMWSFHVNYGVDIHPILSNCLAIPQSTAKRNLARALIMEVMRLELGTISFLEANTTVLVIQISLAKTVSFASRN